MISVALVDDHKLLRSGLSNFIKTSSGFTVLFEADNGKDMQDKITPAILPDIILMDINMPIMDGYLSTQWMYKNYPKTKVIALSMYDSEDCIIRMLRCGARGYLLKDVEPSELLKAMEEVHKSGFYYSPLVSRHVIHLMNSNEDDPNAPVTLTPKEIELLQLMASELTYKEIADKMFISHKTVDGYRERIGEKLQIKTRVGMVMYAIKNGIVMV